jgi:hypothetical protein
MNGAALRDTSAGAQIVSPVPLVAALVEKVPEYAQLPRSSKSHYWFGTRKGSRTMVEWQFLYGLQLERSI